MESVKLCWVRTSWMLMGLLCLSSTSAAHSEDIHDVRNHQERSDETSKWTSPSAKQVNSDVYEDLCQENLDLAEKTLKLPFLQHMQQGDLQADRYTTFMIQDIFYLAEVTDMLRQMSEKKGMPNDLKAFLKGRYESYDRVREQVLQEFTLNGVKDIRVILTMKTYLEEYKRAMDEEKPIMFAVSLLPCSRLWVWLANKLTIDKNNAYWNWKESNKGGNPGKFRDLLNKHLKENKDVERAKKIFRDQMQNELNFFKASLPN